MQQTISEVHQAVKPVLYTSIHKLTLSRFQDALCDDDYTALIVSGEPTPEELSNAWQEILSQWTEATAGPEQKRFVRLSAEITRLQLQVQQVVMLTSVLEKRYVKRFGDYINRLLKTSFSFDVTKPEQYDKELVRCLKRVKEWELLIQAKAAQLQAMAKEQATTTEKFTREQFQRTLLTLSDAAGRELDENVMTVFQFAERLKRYNRNIQHNSLKN